MLFWILFLIAGCSSGPLIYDKAPQFIWPVKKGHLTQKFKFIGRNHDGIDIGSRRNTPIYATAPGQVLYAGQKLKGYGKIVILQHLGGDWTTFYAHLEAIKVRIKQRVKRGDLIGLMGDTGRARGVHLHFEIRHGGRPLNPLLWLPGENF